MIIYTYLLKSLKDGSFYVGITKDLQNRLHEIAFFKKHTTYEGARKNEIWLKKKNVVYKNRLTTIGRELIPPSQTG